MTLSLPTELLAKCPPESDLKNSVARRLGRDPFAGPPAYLLTITVSAPERPVPRLQAQLWWQDAAGKPQGSREIRQVDRDCKALIEAVAFAVSVKLQLASKQTAKPSNGPFERAQDITGGAQNPREKTASASSTAGPRRESGGRSAADAQTTSAGSAPAATATPSGAAATKNASVPPQPITVPSPPPKAPLPTEVSAPPALSTRDTPADATTKDPALRWSAGAGIFAASGVVPGLGWGGRGLAAVEGPRHFSLELALEATLPATLILVDGTGFSASAYGLTIAPCVPAGRLRGCLLAGTGLLRARGSGLDSPRTSTGLTWFAGIRVAAAHQFNRQLWVGPHIDFRVAPDRWSVTVNGVEVWKSPSLMLLVGIDMGTGVK